MTRRQLILLALLVPRPGVGQIPLVAGQAAAESVAAPDSTARQTSPPVQVSAASPRASVRAYLEAARSADWTTAARYLQVPAGADGEELARKLKSVLDRRLWVDLDRLSPLAAGRLDDNLPVDREEVGVLAGRAGSREVDEPVRLTRLAEPAPGRWVFSLSTVQRVDSWYAQLGNVWLRDHIPPGLERVGPFDILLWQWVGLVVALSVAIVLALLLRRLTTRIEQWLVTRTPIAFDNLLIARTRAPMLLFWTVLFFRLAIVPLGLSTTAGDRVALLVRAGFIAAFFWVLLRVIGVFQDALPRTAWAIRNPAGRSIVPLLARVARALVGILGVIAIVGSFGYPVATLLAGLGIGGIAVALGAQKTLEHFFGSVSLALDQPLRVGDFVLVGKVLGTVEALGLRSTRIRTLDRTIVTIPNGDLSNQQIENFAVRDRIKLGTVVGLTYGTTAAQLREIVTGFERVLRSRPELWADSVTVRFVAFGESSLDVEVMCWFIGTYDEFRVIREEVFFGFMEVVETAGSGFAFPTRTVHLEAGSTPLRVMTDRPAPGQGAQPPA
jgi:MscS family membrane protein